jgi:hypothetical protein
MAGIYYCGAALELWTCFGMAFEFVLRHGDGDGRQLIMQGSAGAVTLLGDGFGGFSFITPWGWQAFY